MAETNQDESGTRGRRRRGRSRRRRVGEGAEPVPLHKRSASHFQPGDRQYGSDYFLDERVHLEVEDGGGRARARVDGDGEEQFRVGLDWSEVDDRVLHAFCECQRFSGGRACRHIWATLLALAESGPENQPIGRDRLALRKDRAAAWSDLGVSAELEQQPEDSNGSADQERPARRAHHARLSRERAPRREHGGRRAPKTTWRSQLASVRQEVGRILASQEEPEEKTTAIPAELRLLVNTVASANGSGLVVDIFEIKSGPNAKLKKISIEPLALEGILTSESSEEAGAEKVSVVASLQVKQKSPPTRGRRGKSFLEAEAIARFRLPESLYDSALPRLCEKGMLGWWNGRVQNDQNLLTLDGGAPWRVALLLEMVAGGGVRLSGQLERDEERVPLSSILLIRGRNQSDSNELIPALMLLPGSLARLEVKRELDRPWIEFLRSAGEVLVPKEDLEEALTTLLELPGLPPLDAPDEFRLSQEVSAPVPRLMLETGSAPAWLNPPLLAELSFDYGTVRVSAGDPRPSVVEWEQKSYVRRDSEAEHKALVRLLELGLHPVQSREGHDLEIGPHELPGVAEPLLAEGWSVEVHGRSLFSASPPDLKVESGIDWFELSGSMDFAGDPVAFSEILDLISRGERFVELEDGSQGLLPASWMETYDSLSKLAHSSSDEGLRFLPSQALLVDALLAATPPVDVDAEYAQLRQKLSSFERIQPKKELKSFSGELRSYQRHGLGWLDFLREFGLGGVLADDMGLGKTVQVLALLQANRTPAKNTKLPSLVVAPRSLVYNWIEEASRFTPKLRAVEYAGADREKLQGKLNRFDLVVTTYGTMRRDIGFLSTVEFDTVIIDEAQAIKNPASQTAKASALLTARHRLALTGTPIENHLGELGSIFEFVNPGLLGRLPKLEVLAAGRAPTQTELALVAKGIRPFILRRTKAEVLPDLPPKTEQVLYCSLRPRQRELYDQLRAGYQVKLMQQVEAKGVGGSAIQVLEALLRLRQVACHPGLVNPEWNDVGSAKLEALFEQMKEVLDEGHKLIVFSQFTKLLAYVRGHLEEQGMPYAYLDGQTRNRGEVVERFQTDSACNIFLVSLKAGGVGLNLTAAGYVFLLDPWWNPAVEAQAIDRAHRIGQTQPVFAYRMIARDTVEEKIVELQRSKKELADAVLDGESLPLRDLTADDLRMLLS